MRIAVVGCGGVGARVARQLVSTDAVDGLVLCDVRDEQARTLARSLGDRVEVVGDVADADVDGVVLASDAGTQFALARAAVAAGRFVVATSDALDEVRLLQTLDAAARTRQVAVVLGAGFAPGLTCVLAQLAASRFDHVDEVHVAKVGTGGPACARQHHRAFRGHGVEWRDGAWEQRRGGSGRALSWFPEPIGGRDCYHAALADTVLQVAAFPSVRRVTARIAATRRDRLTMHLPMLRPPHEDGGVGAVRVEVRGRVRGASEVVVLGAIDRPGVAAGAIAAQSCTWIHDGRLRRPGAGGLGELVEPKAFLRELAVRGVRAAVFDGTPRTPALPEPLTR
jgi:saccharopine dehydrogenase-like NADP-dependent oxidoreductase